MTLRDKIADARPALGVVHGFPDVAGRTPLHAMRGPWRRQGFATLKSGLSVCRGSRVPWSHIGFPLIDFAPARCLHAARRSVLPARRGSSHRDQVGGTLTAGAETHLPQ